MSFFNLFKPLIPILGINRTPFENAFLSSDRQSASVRLPGDLPSRRQLVRPARRVVFRLGAIQLLDSQPEEAHGGGARGQGAAHKSRRGHQHGWERQPSGKVNEQELMTKTVGTLHFPVYPECII